MNYINVEEFLKQKCKVQETIKIWLEENMQEKEWVKFIEEGGELSVDSVLDTRKDNINVGRVFYFDKCLLWSSIYDPNIVPLLQMHQLINFIECKTNKDLSHWRDIDDNEFRIYLTNRKIDKEFGGNIIINQEEFDGIGFDLLNALWKVAIQIAERK